MPLCGDSQTFRRVLYSTATISAIRPADSGSPLLKKKRKTMAFVVHEIDNLPESPPAVFLRSSKYPPNDIAGVVTTEIGLWEVDKNVGGLFTLSYWKSLFNRRKDYNIILHQKDPVTSNGQSFLLHATDKLEVSKDAFDQVCDTLRPLVDDCTLLLTEELLEEIILPEPKMASELAHHLVEVMESNPGAHTDWVKVLQALVLAAIGTDGDDDDEIVEKLLSKTDVKVADRHGNTALHLAKSASNVKRVVKKATEKMSEEDRKKMLNQPNREGKAPLHSAFEQNNPEVVRELVQAGAEFDTSTQDERGSNPFHMAAERGSAESIGVAHHRKDYFLQRESFDNPEKQRLLLALNSPNNKGYTPLMISVQKGYINSVVTFLQAGAHPDTKHRDSGNTALHYAAEQGNSDLVKALIAFGADIKIQNGRGQTPLDVAFISDAEGAKECSEILKYASEKMKEANDQVSDVFEPIPIPPNSVFLLSMDGGGTRGLLLTQTLIAIQSRMKELKPDCEPVHKYFDYVAGTSAGGLITLSIVCAGASLEAVRASLFKAGDEICALPPTFPDEVVARSAKETYGEDTMMTDIQKPRVIVPTVLADRNPPLLHLVCNYGEGRNEQKPPNQWKVWEASRATSAAPVYFPPFMKKFVDGGVMANNPTLDAMAEIFNEIEKEGNNAKLALVVSIGTGIPPSAEVEDVHIYVPNLTNPLKAIVNLPDTLSALGNFLNLLIAQATVSNGQEIVRTSAWCKSLGTQYYRLSPELDKVIDLTENDKKVLTDMMYQGSMYLLTKVKDIDMIARYLLSQSMK